jgi:hypothetical protein
MHALNFKIGRHCVLFRSAGFCMHSAEHIAHLCTGVSRLIKGTYFSGAAVMTLHFLMHVRSVSSEISGHLMKPRSEFHVAYELWIWGQPPLGAS